MRYLSWAFVTSLVLTGAGKLAAEETVPLSGTGDATLQSLVFDGQADTDAVYWRGWGYRGWGYRPYGFWRPFAFRPYFYRPFAYRPYFYGYPAYASYYAPSYYVPSYAAPVYSYYVDPCSADVPSMPDAVVLGSSSQARGPIFQTPSRKPAQTTRPPTPPGIDDTYTYDGGPSQPLPLPGQDAAPTFDKQRPTVPLSGTLVSIPSRPARYTFPAYGETAPSPKPAQATPPRFVPRMADTTRIAYPAYGER
jgi:hypothetical protein